MLLVLLACQKDNHVIKECTIKSFVISKDHNTIECSWSIDEFERHHEKLIHAKRSIEHCLVHILCLSMELMTRTVQVNED